MLGGPASPHPCIFFEKNGAIWCTLGHILAFKTYLFFCKIIKNVAFADKSKKKKKKRTLNEITYQYLDVLMLHFRKMLTY